MVDAGCRLCFPLESQPARGVHSYVFPQHLDRHHPLQCRFPRQVHLRYRSLADATDDLQLRSQFPFQPLQPLVGSRVLL